MDYFQRLLLCQYMRRLQGNRNTCREQRNSQVGTSGTGDLARLCTRDGNVRLGFSGEDVFNESGVSYHNYSRNSLPIGKLLIDAYHIHSHLLTVLDLGTRIAVNNSWVSCYALPLFFHDPGYSVECLFVLPPYLRTTY